MQLISIFFIKQVLESFQIMDYSLLIGVHNLEIGQREHEGAAALASAAQESRKHMGQKALYSTAMESIQGVARRGSPVETDDNWWVLF